jgi:hypothetical protein
VAEHPIQIFHHIPPAFSILFVVNMALLIFAMCQKQKLVSFMNAATTNLVVGGLARQPLMVNTIFRVVCSILRSALLILRRISANTYHYGGVHSSCGIAGLSKSEVIRQNQLGHYQLTLVRLCCSPGIILVTDHKHHRKDEFGNLTRHDPQMVPPTWEKAVDMFLQLRPIANTFNAPFHLLNNEVNPAVFIPSSPL